MLVFSRAQQWIIAATVAILLFAVAYIAVHRHRPADDRPLLEEAPPAAEQSALALTVDVGGEVLRPGLYRMASNSRVCDAIRVAGGLTSRGDTAALNLAAFLQDGDKVLVPGRPLPPAPPAQPTPAASASAPPAAPSAAQAVNVNWASAADLERLPGVGPALAQRIVEYRLQHGYFLRLEDLMQVHGIGPKKLEALRPFVTLSP